MKMQKIYTWLFLLCATTAQALFVSNKTYIAPRPAGTDLPMTTAFLNHARNDADNVTTAGAAVQVTGFYQDSLREDELGRYFGIGRANTISFSRIAGTTTEFPQLDINTILQFYNGGAAFTDYPYLTGSLELNASRKAYGAAITAYAKIPCEFPMFATFEVPILHVEHLLKATATAEALGNDKGLLTDFLKGEYSSGAGVDQQEALKFAKIDSKTRSKSGFGDARVSVGAKIVNTEDYDVALHAALTAPLGTEATGEFAFEPILGNGHHWGVGLGADATCAVAVYDNFSIDLLGSARGTYLLAGDEIRTLQGRTDIKVFVPWCHYFRVGTQGELGVKPLANVSTLSVEVKPGITLEGTLALSLQAGPFVSEAGYHCYAREGERIALKTWPDGIGYAAGDYSGAVNFNNAEHTDLVIDITAIERDEGGISAASTPGSILHKVYAGVGYHPTEFDMFAFSIGAGASYEWAPSTNAAMPHKCFWGKVAAAF
jgi:hypothetical protein